MKALVKTAKGEGNIEVLEVRKPELTEKDWVLIKVKAAGVCGTDLHIRHDQFPYWPPVVLGHEFSGEIEEVGKDVKNLKKGDRVVAEPHSMSCGLCEYCRKGMIQLCESKRSPGWGINGAFTDYIKMPARLIHKIPDNVDYRLAALAEPLAIAVHQVAEQNVIDTGDCVLVTGSGPMGILSAFIAEVTGAGKVIMTGLTSGEILRFKIALETGTDYIINIEKEDLTERIKELNNGRNIDTFIETSGSASAIRDGINALKKKGKVSAIGLCSDKQIPFPWNTAMQKALDLRFNFSSSYSSWDKALCLLDKHGDTLSKLITHTFRLEEWESVFTDLEAEKGVKALYIPQ